MMATQEIGRRSSLPPYNTQLIPDAVQRRIPPGPKSRGRGRPKKDPNGPPGEVVILKNNYLSSDSNKSVRHGRGRPPKPKDPLAEAAVAPPGPKSRGRPKKDPNASSAPKKQKVDPIPVPFIGDVASPPVFKTGRPRGRPIKEGGGVNFLKNKYLGPDPNNLVSPGRGRGRPQKPKAAVVSSPPKSRGRPKKDPIVPPTPNKQNLNHDPIPVPVPFTGDEASPPVSKTRKPRGRPIKVSTPVSKTGRPRGRPIKISTPVSETGKPRGRPRKFKHQAVLNSVGIEGI